MTDTAPQTMQAEPEERSARIFGRREERRRHWDEIAETRDSWHGVSGAYHRRIADVYRLLIPRDSRVLEIGCGMGELLAALEPSKGVGIDFSERMVDRAQEKHPDLTFMTADAHEFELDDTFDFIILSDLVNDIGDVQTVLERARKVCHPRTRIIINVHSQLWRLPLTMARGMGMATPVMAQNWLTAEDVAHMLYLAGFEVLRTWQEVLFPLPIPLLAGLCNRYFVKMWPGRIFALSNFVMARPNPTPRAEPDGPVVSVIVAARNEAGNVDAIFERTPEMGAGTELIFVEGGSQDDTYEVIEKAIADRPGCNAKLFKQPGVGKGDAVRVGFENATGDVLMILDADLTVPPELLPRFVEALRSGKADFVNGVRLVYPMEDRAMRFCNLIGNKFFSLAFSWMLGQSIKDTLCGTKVMWKQDYDRLAANRAYFGDFDPFGDFDLLFGAAKLNLRIVDLPIRYQERVYGDTNIQRWRHGVILLRMVMFAARRIKFV